MDTGLFMDMLCVDSTTGREGEFAAYLVSRLSETGCKVERFPVEMKCEPLCRPQENILLSWGEPSVIFCTHLDTVPPYIPPTVIRDDRGEILEFRGRGTCDAKGQIFSMYQACVNLAKEGHEGFGLLLLAGEETGSFGAKAFRDMHPGAEWVIVGEPTDNAMASASKGTKSFEVTFTGKAAHSGYPGQGASAVLMFNEFINALRSIEFPEDEILGATTWNIGKLCSDNPQNILSEKLSCRVYFRTTFATDALVSEVMRKLASEIKGLKIKEFGGDTPMKYTVLDGFETTVAAFGSDAPQLSNFKRKILCGPGSILLAHTMEEYVEIKELEKATEQYIRMYEQLS